MAQPRTKDKCRTLTLFGGDEEWDAADWIQSDDSVRGGQSESYLDIEDGNARFHGVLDIETLGGAGFASQRTTGDERKWDLSEYVGISLEIAKGDKKRYTFIVKDDLLPANAANGREQATISWEVDFELPPQDKPDDTCDKTIFIPWESFNPTYRGKLQDDVDPLDTKKIKRFSIMNRSFFGAQEGKFSLTIKSISAVCEVPPPGDGDDDEDAIVEHHNKEELNIRQLEEGSTPGAEQQQDRSYYVFGAGSRRFVYGNFKIHRRTAHTLIAAALVFAAYHYFCR